jgi:hypothetical protein
MARNYAIFDIKNGEPIKDLFFHEQSHAIVKTKELNKGLGHNRYAIVHGPDHPIVRAKTPKHWWIFSYQRSRNHLNEVFFVLQAGPRGLTLVVWEFIFSIGRPVQHGAADKKK